MNIEFKDVLDNMLDVYTVKNNDYGDSFSKQLDEFGVLASIVRMSDKVERLKTLSNGISAMVKNESIEDTLLDLANYSAMTYMWLKNKNDENIEKGDCRNGWVGGFLC